MLHAERPGGPVAAVHDLAAEFPENTAIDREPYSAATSRRRPPFGRSQKPPC